MIYTEGQIITTSIANNIKLTSLIDSDSNYIEFTLDDWIDNTYYITQSKLFISGDVIVFKYINNDEFLVTVVSNASELKLSGVPYAGFVLVNRIEKTIHSVTQKIKMIAHRGMSGFVAENTISSFECAGIYGYWGCETDVRETSDGKFVLIHDETIDRTTNGTGRIQDLSYEYIRSVNIDVNISNCYNKTIPNLTEYLLVCRRFGMTPVIEIKKLNSIDSIDRLIAEISNVFDTCVILCSDIQSLTNIKKRIDYDCYWLVTSVPLLVDYDRIKSNRINISGTTSLLTNQTFLDRAHIRGIRVGIWTITTQEQLEIARLNNIYSVTVDKLLDYDNYKCNRNKTISDIEFIYSVIDNTLISSITNLIESQIPTNYYISKHLLDVVGMTNITIRSNIVNIRCLTFDCNGNKILDTIGNSNITIPGNSVNMVIYTSDIAIDKSNIEMTIAINHQYI